MVITAQNFNNNDLISPILLMLAIWGNIEYITPKIIEYMIAIRIQTTIRFKKVVHLLLRHIFELISSSFFQSLIFLSNII